MEKLNAGPTPIQELNSILLSENKVRFFLKRDDQLFDPAAPDFNGNKWRKMKYNLFAAREQGKDTLLTFGGAYSNHIAATAAAAKLFGFKSIGIIRGEQPAKLNPTLKRVLEQGMQLEFITRSAYREKNDPVFIQNLHKKYGDFYLLPEGGSNNLALKGCAEIVREIEIDFQEKLPDFICCGCGTGGTFAGIVTGIDERTQAIGFSALKGNFHTAEVENLLERYDGKRYKNWEINNDYHFGGFAKHKPALIDFINQFKTDFDIQLEPLYTGKMLFGIYDLIQKGFFPEGSTILAVHTGGLQGITGFNERFGGIINAST
ncbi:MAG: 1-aminocyclopropane-1-carboxylate deaminase/D-cysteine desulfhydrase [Bacteroidetes bacterium]|nr:MAG: 1-aminocyclopropane-1-carboxylate deaminase/D-cysteine desulfhydrase [Bacteroidota bacterium]